MTRRVKVAWALILANEIRGLIMAGPFLWAMARGWFA